MAEIETDSRKNLQRGIRAQMVNYTDSHIDV